MELMITKDNGELVSHKYLKKRVRSALSRWRRFHSLDERNAIIRKTIDNPEWMRGKYGQTVGSIIRAVEFQL